MLCPFFIFVRWNRESKTPRNQIPIKYQTVFTHVAGFYANLLKRKKVLYIRKEFISHRFVLVHQRGRRFIVLEHQYGRRDVMWKCSVPLSD